ncbi:MAG: zinc-finger domain-containing protein [Rhodospirillales bacterium]
MEPTEPTETVYVDSRTVACDGNGGPLGHPRVYLSLEKEGEIVCPYCSRRFVLAAGAKEAAGH